MAEEDSIKSLRANLKRAQGERSLRAFASSLGYSHSYLSEVMNGARPPSDELLAKVGIEKEVKVTYKLDKRRWR
jgi:transcriptional regulator with XRE-family HTH domain